MVGFILLNREGLSDVPMKGLTSAQIEQLKGIVDQLKLEREKQGVLLEEIALKTYVPLRQLQALEKGDVNILPEPVFVQGFIRRYADALGLDGMALSKSFEFQPTTAPQSVSSVEVETPLPPQREVYLPKPADPPRQPKVRSPQTGLNPLSLIAAGAAALLIGFGIFELTRPKQATRPQATTPDTEVGTIQSAPSPSPTTSPTISPSPAQKPATEVTAPVQVSINATERSWLEVYVDGKAQPEISEVVDEGYQKIWTAKKSLRVKTGNAGGIEVGYNTAAPKVMGAAGEVKEMTYVPNLPEPSSLP
ncbi:MAG TPA: helix-turn-helix domain-containing protein [Leptolyngbyaceae cyanobacterium M33_DOE_097]|uniref:Helix-turn-helix domain-containing protein n=1 Tax=Oscillatoriales cyanobacterium SpSt-418 TaxID=2282169 RepID=A0A7C3KIK4_9CYAN|nr:helix-turn-helix domain-containing protein [Leptolyngbyaceae cyanobacterium M33_DOE_097]